jgi:hypothetical protein
MQRAGEQQERQHSVHEGRVKVDPGQEADDLLADLASRQKAVDPDHNQRGQGPHDRDADRRRKANEPMIYVSQGRRQHDEHGCRVEGREAGGVH